MPSALVLNCCGKLIISNTNPSWAGAPSGSVLELYKQVAGANSCSRSPVGSVRCGESPCINAFSKVGRDRDGQAFNVMRFRVTFTALLLGLVFALAGISVSSDVPSERFGQIADQDHWQVASILPTTQRVLIAVPDQSDDGLEPRQFRQSIELPNDAGFRSEQELGFKGHKFTTPPARGPPGIAT